MTKMTKIFKYKNTTLRYDVFGKEKELILYSPGMVRVDELDFNFIKELKKNFTILTYNYPGVKKSSRKIKNSKQIAKIVFELLKELKIEKLNIIGFSAGSIVSLELCKFIKPKRLILLNPLFINYETRTTLLIKAFKTAFKVRFKKKKFVKVIVREFISENSSENFLKMLERDIINQGVYKTLYFAFRLARYVYDIDNFSKQTLIITGDKDGFMNFKELNKLKKKNHEIIIEKEGSHYLCLEKPKKITKFIENYFSKTSS